MNFRPAMPPPFRPFSPQQRVLPSRPLRCGNTGGRRSLIHSRQQRNPQRHRKPRRLNRNMIQVPGESPCVSAGLDVEVKEHTGADTGLVNHWDQDAQGSGCRRGRRQYHPATSPGKERLLMITESLRDTTSTECWPRRISPTNAAAQPAPVFRPRRATAPGGLQRRRALLAATDDDGPAGAHSTGVARESRQCRKQGRA